MVSNTSLELGIIGTTGLNISKYKKGAGLQFIIWLGLLNRGLVRCSTAVLGIYNQGPRNNARPRAGHY